MGLDRMRDMVTRNSSKKIVTERNKKLALSGQISTTPTNIFGTQTFFRILNDLTYDLVKLTGDWGVADDPVDEAVRLVLGSFDPSAIIGIADGVFQDSNFWQEDQNWRAVGTPANAINTLRYVDADLISDDELRFHDPGASTNLAVGMLGFSTTISIVFRDFRLWWVETYIQRTFTDPVGEWSGYTDEEVWGNEDTVETENA